MAIPDYQSLMLPLLRLAADEQEHTFREAVDLLATEFQLSDEEKSAASRQGRQPIFNKRLVWAKSFLAGAHLLHAPGGKPFVITQRGTEVLAENPARIDKRFLEQFPEFVQFLMPDKMLQSEMRSEITTVPTFLKLNL